MRKLHTLLFIFILLAATNIAVAQDKVQFGVDYGRASLKPNFADPLQDVNAVAVHALVTVAGAEKDGFRLRAGAEVRKTFNVEVFSDYPVPSPGPVPAEVMPTIDIYRDVYTYYGIGALAYRRKFLELEARAKLGAEKPHEDLSYRFTRAYEFRGTIVAGHFGLTPLIVGYKKESQGFVQYFGAGASFRF